MTEWNQDELLKKPGGMGKVPFGWASIIHTLKVVVFVLKRLTQLQAKLPYCVKMVLCLF